MSSVRSATMLVVVVCSAACGPPLPLSTWSEPTIGMEFVFVPAGGFVMGTPVDEIGREVQERQHG